MFRQSARRLWEGGSLVTASGGRREIDQLLFGSGQIIQGNGVFIFTKALLENGVGYPGGYPVLG